MRIAFLSLVSVLTTLSCTQVLGIDGRYVLAEQDLSGGGGSFGSGGSTDAGVASGGRFSTGGKGTGGIPIAGGGAPMGGTGGSSTGGIGGSGGTIPDADAQVPCAQGQKRCPNIGCVSPDPSVGCDLGPDCKACPVPDNSSPICTNQQCEYQCYQNYDRNAVSGACELHASGTGGASGGAGGAGGAGGGGPAGPGAPCSTPTPLDPSPECKCIGFPGCCNVTSHCGCLWVRGICT